MLRNLMLFALLGCVFSQDVNRCAWGESYVCSSLKVAKMCGEVPRCITTVWAQTKLAQDSNETCTFCENIIGDVRNYLTNEQTQEQIEQFLDAACTVIPDPNLSSQCKQAVAQDLPELFDMIKAELDPQMICAAIGLCSGLKDLVYHKQPVKPNNPIERMQTAIQLDVCADCQTVMSELISEFKSSMTEQEVEDFLDTKFCSQLGSLEPECKILVAAYVPELLQMLYKGTEPATICAELGFCNRTSEMVKEFQKMQLKAHPKSAPHPKVSASVQCVLCEYVMTELDSILGENSTEEEIMAALDKVCSLFPSSVSGECTAFVNEYGQAVLTLLVHDLEPSQICTFIGLCSTTLVDSVKYAGTECTLCETVFQYLDSLLSENATKGEIEMALDKVCNFLSPTMKDECTQLVKTYEPVIIQLFESLTPEQLCQEIDMCPQTKVVEETIVPKKQPLLGETECTWGPSYWCASRDNAKRCKAEAHCVKHVWNTK